jgi:hypothetical protein
MPRHFLNDAYRAWNRSSDQNSHGPSPLCQKILTRPYGYKTCTISWRLDGWMDGWIPPTDATRTILQAQLNSWAKDVSDTDWHPLLMRIWHFIGIKYTLYLKPCKIGF